MFKNFKKCHCFEVTIFNLNQNNNAAKKEIENKEDKFDSICCYAVLMTPKNQEAILPIFAISSSSDFHF